MEHTPGPWKALWSSGISIHGPDDRSVASIASSIKRPEGEKAANAYLIAAAPDMLEALEGITGFVERLAGDEPAEAANPELWRKLERARAAIAKAKGSDA